MKKLLLLTALFSFVACNKVSRKDLEKELAVKTEQVDLYKTQLENLQGTNSSLLDRMADLSIVSQTGAENISKSLENISNQYNFIENLSSKIQQKDSLNMALVMNLKRSLIDINDKDVQVEVKGGVVHVSLSDQLLFGSGSTNINPEANQLLEKIAMVINDHNELDIMVEGHTDDVPIYNEKNSDNWDLSVRRAASVVRTLQNDFGVSPERLIAAGRSQYNPKVDNDNSTARKVNRRTEIILTPKMDQFFKLLEMPELKG